LWWPAHEKVSYLKAILGDPGQGGKPEDTRVLADIEAFVLRQKEKFNYDAATKKLSLRTLSVDGMTEAWVVDKLTLALQCGPNQFTLCQSITHVRTDSISIATAF